MAVTSQSTRKRITPKLGDELATALILRATTGDRAKADQVRRYLRYSFGTSVHRETWQSTDRDTAQLVTEALEEIRRTIGGETTTDPGPASLELAVRAAYPLVVSGRLNADRGSQGNPQPDRRHPGEVLDAMRRGLQGVHQLGQALQDFRNGPQIRAVDEKGHIKLLPDGSTEQTVNDVYLRGEFPPPGKAKARRAGTTPTDLYENALGTFSGAIEALQQAFAAIGTVNGDDGRPLIEARGAEPRSCEAWRAVLRNIEDELIMWGRTFQKAFGTRPEPQSEQFYDEDTQLDSEEEDSENWENEDLLTR